MDNKWIKTDDLQFIYKLDEDFFDVITIMKHPERGYLVIYEEIHVYQYSDDELNHLATLFGYKGYEDVKNQYGDSSGQIMAEIISETQFFEKDLEIFASKSSLNNWLKNISKELSI